VTCLARRPHLSHKSRPLGVEPPVQRHLLGNGLAVVLCPRPHLSQCYVATYFGVGSRHETAEQNGISHVLEHMLFRGTASYGDATALNAAAEDFGGFLDGATYRDHMVFATGCHPSALDKSVSILAELIQSPRYQGMEIERAVLREELLETLDSRGRVVDLDNIVHRLAFGSHGLGLPIEGTLAILDSIEKRELEAHRSRFLVAANGVLSVAGPMDASRVLTLAERQFASLPRGQAPLTQVPAAGQPEPQMRFVRDSSSQVDIRISFRAVPMHDPSYPALVMLARLLADGLASRMHAELVDRRGLAYTLNAGLTTYSDVSLFDFEVAVAPHRAAQTIKTLLQFAHSCGHTRFAEKELERTRRRYRYGVEFMSDSAPDLASWYGRAVLFGVEEPMATLGSQIMRLRDAEVRKVARDLFRPSGMIVSAVGQLARGEWQRVQDAVMRWAKNTI
jgi:predicted Zn-dependent peptidase